MSPPRGNRPDLRLYLVTPDPMPAERLLALCLAATRGGVGTVQLRAKGATTDERVAVLRTLRRRLPEAVTLVVNDDVAAAAAVRGTGVHVGPDDVAPTLARERLGADVCVGWSLHRPADHAVGPPQWQDAAALAAVDYVAVSPVWPTPTKIDTTPAWGLAGIRRLHPLLPAGLPLVAIGGIDRGNAAAVRGAGADGVAVVSALAGATDPEAAARTLLAELG